jgi:hypothetical protein
MSGVTVVFVLHLFYCFDADLLGLLKTRVFAYAMSGVMPMSFLY